MEPIIEKKYSDNGMFSHWSIIDADSGETIIDDVLLTKKLLNNIQNGYERIEDDSWVCFSLNGHEAKEFIG